VTTDDDGEKVVTALPITHTPPNDPEAAVEIPLATKMRLGLDDDRSWIILTEANRFTWPGPDLRILNGDSGSVAYGLLPRALFNEVITKFLSLLKKRNPDLVRRSE
jgi:hypothetical protein